MYFFFLGHFESQHSLDHLRIRDLGFSDFECIFLTLKTSADLNKCIFKKKRLLNVSMINIIFAFIRFRFFFVQGISQSQLRQYPPNPTMVMRSIINMNNPNAMMSRNQLTTINQSQLSAQLGLNMAGPNITHTSPSPPASKSATPSPSSSINEDDQDDGSKVRDLWPLNGASAGKCKAHDHRLAHNAFHHTANVYLFIRQLQKYWHPLRKWANMLHFIITLLIYTILKEPY